MRVIKNLIKYLSFFVLGALTCALFGFVTVTYLTVDQLTKALRPTEATTKMSVAAAAKTPLPHNTEAESIESVNPNLREISRIGRDYAEELTLFEQLVNDISQKHVPEICLVLCNPTSLDAATLREERTFYLADHYKREGARSLEDPLFRLKVEEIGLIADILPKKLHKILFTLKENPSPSVITKLNLAMHLEVGLFEEVTNFPNRVKTFKEKTRTLEALRALYRSCQRGTPQKQVVSECRSHFASH